MRIKCLVHSPDGEHSFSFQIRPSNKQEMFHLDPVEFYQKWGKEIPQGMHHELEIIEPGESFFEKHKLHITRSRRTNKPFVCYPRSLPTINAIIPVVRVWSVGSVATMTIGNDVNRVIADCAHDLSKVEARIKAHYQIWAPPLHLQGPVLYPLTKESLERFRNPNLPWQHLGYYTIELGDNHPENCVPNVLDREENVVIVPAGTIYAEDRYMKFQASDREFELEFRYIKNIRDDKGEIVWMNKKLMTAPD